MKLGAMLVTAIVATAAFFAASLARPNAALAVSCSLGERADKVASFASTANGADARWVVRSMSAPYYWYNGDHVNHTIWVGANGQSPTVTWAEVGTLAGSQNGDLQNNWTYYSARGINYPNSYAAVNFSSMGAPALGTTHIFAAFYNGSSFQVDIDGASHYYWASITGPTVEYDVGFEGTCASGDTSTDTLNSTYVNWLASHRQSDGAWVQSDHGTFINYGSGAGGIAWCSSPYSFRDWLNTSDTGCS